VIRYIEVRVTPLRLREQCGHTTHEVEFTVRTERERLTRRQLLPEEDFESHFHWMLAAIEREVIERAGVANID